MALTPRQQFILEHCKTPKTINDLSTECHTGYYTVRKEVIHLQQLNLLSELPYKQGLASLYQASFDVRDGEVVGLQFAIGPNAVNGTQLLDALIYIAESGSAKVVAKTPAYALAKIMLSYLTSEEDTGYPSINAMKQVLSKASEANKRAHEVCEQLLNAPIWDNDEFVKLLLAQDPPPVETLKQLCLELTDLAIERDW